MQEKPLKNLFKNIGIRLIALFSALLLWFYVVLEKQYETTLTFPLHLVNVPESLTPSDSFPVSARAVVSGKGKELVLLIFTHAELLINCDKVQRGPNLFSLSATNTEISVQSEVTVLFFRNPSEITVSFDAVVEKTIPVLPDINVTLSNSVTLRGEPVLNPAVVTVKGPRSNVARVEHLETHLIQVTRLAKDTAFFAFVKRPELFGVEVTPNKIRVSLSVAPIEKKEITGIPIKLINVPPGINVHLDTAVASLMVAGASEEVESVRGELINIYVNYSRFSIEQLTEVEPAVSIIGNVEWSNLQPKTVRLVQE